jgi:predicted short-subunit dehydrogenase-like oxidoreductase (DUF2520 family)
VNDSKKNLKVALVGPGRLGQALGRLLADRGVSIYFVAAQRIEAARRAASFIGQGAAVLISDPKVREADIFLIATSDDAIASLKLPEPDSHSSRQRPILVHTAGSLPSAILHQVVKGPAAVASMHPYQTVPSPDAGLHSLRGCFWALEGDAAAVRLLRKWVKLLDGVAFQVPSNAKPLYHLSAFLSCPTIVTLMAESAKLLELAGVPERIARPMLSRFVAETARNFESLGSRALTGPAVRGDMATTQRHLEVLRNIDPAFVQVYRSLHTAMLRLAGNKQSARLSVKKSIPDEPNAAGKSRKPSLGKN